MMKPFIDFLHNINHNFFTVILYAISAVYFAGVMVRLMLTLTPVVCMLAGIAFSDLLELFFKEEDSERDRSNNGSEEESEEERERSPGRALYDKAGKLRRMKHERPRGNGDGLGVNLRNGVVIGAFVLMMMFTLHCTWITSNAYSSPSIVLASYSNDGGRAILDDFREAYYWLAQNTPIDARIMSWWDYGYQIAGMANRYISLKNKIYLNLFLK